MFSELRKTWKYSKIPIFNLFHELGKIKNSSWKNILKFQFLISLRIGKNLEVQPKSRNQNPNFESIDELRKAMSFKIFR